MKDLDISKIKKVFFIGIGGIGISGGALWALARGLEVSGVNDEASPKTLEPLRKAGIQIFYQKDLSKLSKVDFEADLYVYSDAWTHRGPEIIEKAKETGKPVLSYFEMLGLFAKEYKVIAISGTHGKTTTTAMVAEILEKAGLDPTVVVGSFVKKFGSNFRKGGGEYLVVEADEYNRHFLNFHPFVGVVTNVEADHLDYYKDLADIQGAFNKFLDQSGNRVMDYDRYLDQVPKLAVPGEYNRMNAAAALAVADILEIDKEVAHKSLSEFSGTWRRLEKKGETSRGTTLYDDYAHHPTEIRASIEALREIYPEGQKNLTILFQPHLYSRTKALFTDFSKSFKGADKILLLPIYFAREEKDDTVSSDLLAEAIKAEGGNALSFPDFEAAENFVKAMNLGPSDVFISMGAGEAHKVAEKVLKTK